MKINYNDLKKHMIVRLQKGVNTINVLVFYLTDKEIKRKKLNADKEGFYGFRGFWYGGNGTKYSSYGKIYDLSYYDNIKLVRGHIQGLTRNDLVKILK